MKKIISSVVVLLMLFILSACSIETVEEYNSRIAAELSSNSESSSDDFSVVDESDVTSSQSSDISEAQTSKVLTPKNSQGSKKNSTADASSSSSGVSSKAADPHTAPPSQSPSNGDSSNSAASSQEDSITITISVTCSQLVGNNDLTSSTKELVPSNGTLLLSTAVKLSKNATVYDALKSACPGKIGCQAGYVYALYGLNEKMFGALSGWKYKVNGTVPLVGCNSFILSGGEVIEWYYTVNG